MAMSFCLLAFDYNIILETRCLGVSVSFLGVPAIAVGLSAISLLAMFPSCSLRIWTRHFDRLSDLVPVPKTRSRFARKGCRSNP